MAEDQKLWFVYLVDHHEGPFSFQELQEKITQKRITEKTLAWKDGMPEWQAMELIPDLQPLYKKDSPPQQAQLATETEAEPVALTIEEIANTDIEKASSPALKSKDTQELKQPDRLERTGSFKIGDPKEVLAKLSSHPTGAMTTTKSSDVNIKDIAGDDNAEIWVLENNKQISGFHSWKKLRDMAQWGRLNNGFRLWHKGWTDFQNGDQFPELHTTKSTKSQITPGNLSPHADKSSSINSIVKKPKTGLEASHTGSISLYTRTATTGIHARTISKSVTGGVRRPPVSSSSGILKKILFFLIFLILIAGGGAAYYLFLYSPLPNLEQITTDDYTRLSTAAKIDINQTTKIAFAQAKGETTFYVASNLPEGSKVTLKLKGKPGTLVNAQNFEKELQASLDSNHLATFAAITDNGKPLPMGEYEVSINAPGAPDIHGEAFIGGLKGPVYQKRLKSYLDKQQEGYDLELQTLREFFETIKNVKTTIDTDTKEIIAIPNIPANREKRSAKIKTLSSTAMLTQLEEKLTKQLSEDYIKNSPFPEAFAQIKTLAGNLKEYQLIQQEKIKNPKTINNKEAELTDKINNAMKNIQEFIAKGAKKP